jgi:RNA polymerase sigma-70 factor (ECF subfamily)
MNDEQIASEHPRPDPESWVDRHGDYLWRFALFRLRDEALAEDVVQETLLAALQSYNSFAGRGSERTWLTGILKHKIIDHYRRTSRQPSARQLADEEGCEHDELFLQSGEWAGHWDAGRGPVEWQTNPALLQQQSEFRKVLDNCLSTLPARLAHAFMLREVEELSSGEVCRALDVSANNLWVMLHRARMHLRHCIEVNWFKRHS